MQVNLAKVSTWMVDSFSCPFSERRALDTERTKRYVHGSLVMNPLRSLRSLRGTVIEATGCSVSIPFIQR
jgi:hypothetical protein